MIAILIPLLVCIIGLLWYALAADANTKAKDLGKIMFAVGLLVTLWHVGAAVLRL